MRAVPPQRGARGSFPPIALRHPPAVSRADDTDIVTVDSAVEMVREHGGVARTSELLRAGIRRGHLTDAVDESRLIRPRIGVYALPDTDPATLQALSHRGAVACVTAARQLGLWVLDEGEHERPHTWVRPEYVPTRLALHPEPDEGACCVFHRDDPVDAPALGRVGILHCLVQILGCKGEEAFFAALESALHLTLLDDTARDALRARIAQRFRWLVDFARADAESGLESLVRLRLHRRGISLATQVDLPGVGIVDFVIGDCLIIEADGGTHDGPSRHRDRMRDAVAVTLGFVTLRFDYAMIVHEWDLVESSVLAAISRNLHRSVAGLTW